MKRKKKKIIVTELPKIGKHRDPDSLQKLKGVTRRLAKNKAESFPRYPRGDLKSL